MALSKIIKESTSTIDTDELSEFYDRDKLTPLLKYAKKNHKLLSNSGTSRIVFVYKDDTVLKIAKNVKGLAQNNEEVSNYDMLDYHDASAILCPIIDYDQNPQRKWIVSRRAKKVKSSDFVGTFGMDFNKLKNVINLFASDAGRFVWDKEKISRGRKLLADRMTQLNLFDAPEDNPFFHLWLAIKVCELAYGDVERLSSWGMVDGRCVLIDYGGTMKVLRQHYGYIG